jgi:hypothetical protein
VAHPLRLTLSEHESVLAWLDSGPYLDIDLDAVQNIHIWSLVALATLAARSSRQAERIQVRSGNEATSRFAHAVGFDPRIGVRAQAISADQNRTVPLQRVKRFEEIEKVASELSHLLVQSRDAEDTRQTIYYIIVEFLRNAVQHSRDPLGAVVGAQLMDKTSEYKNRPMIQVAVGDAGMGIMASLSAMHPEIVDPHQALVMAQQPWISSQFARGLIGTKQNAGLGLFFTAEMAKRTAGRFLIASRGGSIFLQGDENYQQYHHIKDEAPGFPGTIVVFELPAGEIEDHTGLIEVIQQSAKARLPTNISIRWFRFLDEPQKEAFRIGIRVGAEDTAHAQRLVSEQFMPRIAREQPIQIDFSGLRVCTQSFLHALLFTTLRAAFEAQVPLFVSNASPAIQSSLHFLESYALALPVGNADDQ